MSVLDRLGEFPTQDYVIFGADRTPGLAKIAPPDSPRNWDVRQGYGYSGAYVVFTGNGLAKFDVQVFLWKPEQFGEWERFAKKYLDKELKPFPPKGIGVSHPILTMPPINVRSVVIQDVSGWEQDDEGMWSCAIKCLEFRAPRPMLAKPLATIPAAATATPTAQDAADRELQAKLATLRGLAGGQ